jgi:hypothetical protein
MTRSIWLLTVPIKYVEAVQDHYERDDVGGEQKGGYAITGEGNWYAEVVLEIGKRPGRMWSPMPIERRENGRSTTEGYPERRRWKWIKGKLNQSRVLEHYSPGGGVGMPSVLAMAC